MRWGSPRCSERSPHAGTQCVCVGVCVMGRGGVLVAAHLAKCSYEQKEWRKKKKTVQRKHTRNRGAGQVASPGGLLFHCPGSEPRSSGPRLNSLSIRGVNLTFQRLDGAAWGCVLLNLIC